MTLGLWEYFWDLWPAGVAPSPLSARPEDTFYVDAEPLFMVPADGGVFFVDPEFAFDVPSDPPVFVVDVDPSLES